MNDFIDSLLNLPSVFRIFSLGVTRSPDGKYITFVGSGFHENFDVFYFKVDNPGTPIALTNTNELTNFVTWWDDSKSVVVSQDKARNERVTLYRVYLDKPNEFHAITDVDPEYFIRGANFTDDRKTLFYSINYNLEEKKETEIYYLIKHDIETGERKVLTKNVKPRGIFPNVNKQGTLLLYNRSDLDPAGFQWSLIDVDGKNDHEILNFGDKAKCFANWHVNGEDIIFTTDHFEGKQLKRNLAGIYNIVSKNIIWINKEGEELDPILVGKDLNSFLMNKYAPNTMILSETQKAKNHYYLYNIKSKKVIVLPRIPGNIELSTKIGKNWIGTYYSSIQPATPIMIMEEKLENLKLDDLTFLYDNFEKADINKEDLVQAKDYDWISKDGVAIHGWFYKTKIESKKLVVFVHGGPTYHSEDALNTEIQYYLNKGYNVFDPNYRGSTGYGVEFKELIKKDGWGGLEQADITWGVKQLVKEGKIDENYVAITGTSYGGFSAWCGITMYPDIFKVSAPVCGMTDLVVNYETTRPDIRPYLEAMLGGSPEEVPEKYYNGSPINFIDKIVGKVLIVQGANDPNVSPENVRVVEDAMRSKKVEYKKLIFNDEGHGIIRKVNRKRKFVEITQFFDNMLE